MTMKQGSTPSGLAGALAECDKEPIHFIHSIQAHGFLIGLSLADLRIQVVSENVGDHLGVSPAEAVGRRADMLIEPSVIQKAIAMLKAKPRASLHRHFRVTGLGGKSGEFDCHAFETDGLLLMEFEEIIGRAADETDDDLNVWNERVREVLSEMRDCRNVEALAQTAAKAIRALTGLDRVLVYRFNPPSWHGEVVAEDKVAYISSYLNHRFPASDIPQQARELYKRNNVRVIVDAASPTHPLFPSAHPGTGQPLDLSDSRLRAVSPVHLEYLRNMGIRSSMSFAIVSDGHLWGLITGHHLEPFRIPQSRRATCELIANAMGLHVGLMEKLRLADASVEFDLRLRELLASLRPTTDIVDTLFRRHSAIEKMFRASGMALLAPGSTDLAGLTPLREQLESMRHWLDQRMKGTDGQVFHTYNLAGQDQAWHDLRDFASGLLAVRLPDPGTFLVLFRPEMIRTINWGGDPRKQLAQRDFQGKIHPRASFDTWQETVREHAETWTDYEIRGLKFVRDFVFDMLVPRERLLAELQDRLSQPRAPSDSTGPDR